MDTRQLHSSTVFLGAIIPVCCLHYGMEKHVIVLMKKVA